MSIILQINAEVEIKSESLIEVIKKLGTITQVQSTETATNKKEIDSTASQETMTVEEFTKPGAKTYTLEEVRAKLTELSRSGKREEVNQLIASYGVQRLTDVPKEHYESLMEKVGEV